MNDKQQVNHNRRRFLKLATGTATGVGVVLTAKYPFIDSWQPTEQTKSSAAPVDVDISKIESGQQITVQWQGKPIWIIHRTPEQLKTLSLTDNNLIDPQSETLSQQPVNCQNAYRSIKPEILVLIGICTHLGCTPRLQPEEPAKQEGEFDCPCHGARFDLSGRVLKGTPAPSNLVIPPYKYLSDTTIRIGES